MREIRIFILILFLSLYSYFSAFASPSYDAYHSKISLLANADLVIEGKVIQVKPNHCVVKVKEVVHGDQKQENSFVRVDLPKEHAVLTDESYLFFLDPKKKRKKGFKRWNARSHSAYWPMDEGRVVLHGGFSHDWGLEEDLIEQNGDGSEDPNKKYYDIVKVKEFIDDFRSHFKISNDEELEIKIEILSDSKAVQKLSQKSSLHKKVIYFLNEEFEYQQYGLGSSL